MATKQELLEELADLRLRLEEEEETLRAIRNGEVDALVISGPEGEKVYTLKGADHSYRILVETINEGAATLTPDGTIFYANRKLAQMLNLPLERLITSPIVNYIAPADRAWFEALLSQGKQGESQGEVRLQAADGALVPAYLSLSSLKLEGLPDTVCLAATDLTEQKRQEAILAEEQLSRTIFEQAEAVIVVVDSEGRIIRASHEAHQICGDNLLLQRFDQALRLATFDTSGNKSGPAAYRPFSISPILQGRIFHGLEVGFYPPEDGEPLEMLLNAGPLRGSQGEVLGAVVALTDITERKRAEAEREALLADIQAQAEELQAGNEELESQTEELALQAEELQKAHDELEQKVKERTAELRLTVTQLQEEAEKRQETEESLRESENRLRHLASKLLTAQEDERSHLALELHDDLGQCLTALKMQLRRTQRKTPPESSEIRERLEKDLLFVNQIIEKVRSLSRNLRPDILEEMGLTAALRHLFEEFPSQGIQATVDLVDIQELLSPEAQLNIYRIFQEALNNIVKYAHATLVSVGIKREDGSVVFQIEDNGRGFDYQKVVNGNVTDRGLGLTAMHERTRMLGGSLNIWSRDGQGTRITLVVPTPGK
jgi:PAS domain S-box-containing protein